jgi:sulfatase maturation enzyme AslB (radical SAM superfamily)
MSLFSDNFNPSSRKFGQLQRFCSHCDSVFTCDGSCDKNYIIDDRGFCFCPQCWLKIFGDKHTRDEGRAKCTILEKYLKALGREKDFKELGDGC